jgi:hypothetical protein
MTPAKISMMEQGARGEACSFKLGSGNGILVILGEMVLGALTVSLVLLYEIVFPMPIAQDSFSEIFYEFIQ